MMKKLTAIILLFALVVSLSACPKSEDEQLLKITFVDVGQGDAALVECGGENMLIDTGPNNEKSSESVRKLLLEKNIYTLKYLVISHWHDDHYGGLINDALKNVGIERTLCNDDSNIPVDALSELSSSKITVPQNGDTYTLGGATIEIVDVCADQKNDSLVLLITFGDTTFLFTGDIEGQAHTRVTDALLSKSKELKKSENLIKMPHHGAYNSDPFLPDNASDNSLGSLVSAFYAKYFVISVGNNSYGHPHNNTLELIEQALYANDLDKYNHLFRTDECGNVLVTSNGKHISVETSR